VLGDPAQAREVLSGFGKLMASRDGEINLSLEGGATHVAAIVRALDDAGVAVASLDLHEPTLDDVFVEKTGHRLEGAEDGEPVAT
jgi:ABC-2 type transport system ATP-binding protein